MAVPFVIQVAPKSGVMVTTQGVVEIDKNRQKYFLAGAGRAAASRMLRDDWM